MNKELIVDCQRKDNGKFSVRMSRNTNSTLRPNTSNQFKIKRENLFLSEVKTKSQFRRFYLSILLEGNHENNGQSILSQIDLGMNDLIELRNQINYLISDK